MGQPGFLFTPTVPEGFHYRADFLTAAEEDHLAAALERIPFADFEMRGVVARRRVAFFGHSYGHDVVPPVPEFLLPLRAAVAMWAGIEPALFFWSSRPIRSTASRRFRKPIRSVASLLRASRLTATRPRGT